MTYFGILVGGVFVGFFLGGCWQICLRRRVLEEYKEIAEIFSLWMEFLEKGNNIVDRLKLNGYKKVAIYGNDYLGKRLLEQISGTNIRVAYVIEKAGGTLLNNIPVVSLSDHLDKVDAIVVTDTYYYYAIKEKINSLVDYKVISIEEIIKN